MDDERWERKRERWEHRRRRRSSPAGQLFTGSLLVGIGLLFLLGNMGYFDVRFVFRNFWPLILILLGVKMLVVERGYAYGAPGVGLVWLAIGSFFLLSNFRVIDVAFRSIWPFFPLAIGAFLLWRVLVDREERPNGAPHTNFTDSKTSDQSSPPPGSTSNARIWANAALGHVFRRSNSQEFRGGDLHSFAGMCEVDLRGATPVPEGAAIDVSAFMGGIEIRVPPDWTIVNRATAFLGGVEDDTAHPKDESKKLIIRGSVFMGSLELKN